MARGMMMLACVLGLVSGHVVELTNDNFDDLVFNSGKSGFVKFFAPWCGHCKSMKPAWDQLGEEYDASSVVVGDADCTVEKDLCSAHGATGYPTIKYFNAETGKDGEKYSGGRDFDSLKKFVEETLEIKCSISERDGCSEKEIAFMEKMTVKGKAAVDKQHTRLQGMLAGKMKAELKQWVAARYNILSQLKDEL